MKDTQFLFAFCHSKSEQKVKTTYLVATVNNQSPSHRSVNSPKKGTTFAFVSTVIPTQ